MPTQTEEALPREITSRMAVMRNDLKSGDPKSVLGLVYPGLRPLQNRADGRIRQAAGTWIACL